MLGGIAEVGTSHTGQLGQNKQAQIQTPDTLHVCTLMPPSSPIASWQGGSGAKVGNMVQGKGCMGPGLTPPSAPERCTLGRRWEGLGTVPWITSGIHRAAEYSYPEQGSAGLKSSTGPTVIQLGSRCRVLQKAWDTEDVPRSKADPPGNLRPVFVSGLQQSPSKSSWPVHPKPGGHRLK